MLGLLLHFSNTQTPPRPPMRHHRITAHQPSPRPRPRTSRLDRDEARSAWLAGSFIAIYLTAQLARLWS